jgi:ubiquinone/menaquinone biosynthesis C-methylase UbiE
LDDSTNKSLINAEFDRTAESFDRRTRGRFDALDVPGFSRIVGREVVAEIGAGTGAFLSLFEGLAGGLVAVDLTMAMLKQAQRRHPEMMLLLSDGARLPLRNESVDVVASAQVFHHIFRPLPILHEMRRVMKRDGRVLLVDQIAPEHFEEAQAMNELEVLRDPSHAASRPPSAFRVMVEAAGLELLDERIDTSEQRMSEWMVPEEFPPERFDAVLDFIEERGRETGMHFRKAGDDYVFERRRILILAGRP